ncbi:MAG: hypothetical protein MUE85_11040 [Microscillaceae bacterium]|jgi:hypothetical protein|nr:hypothetical protein [Microscillaceae bacterium]
MLSYNEASLKSLVAAILSPSQTEVYEYQDADTAQSVQEIALAVQLAEIIQTQKCDFSEALHILHTNS